MNAPLVFIYCIPDDQKIKYPMKNYTEGLSKLWLLLGMISLFSLLSGVPELNAQDTEAPVFTDPLPPDLVIDCIDNLPPLLARTATDNADLSFPKSILPTDSPNPTDVACSGGLILRIWSAEDASGNVGRDTQRITLQADVSAPIILLPERRDTIYCENRNEVGADFTTWVDTRRLEILFQNQECDLDRIEHNAPANFNELCGTQEVIFTLFDRCGQSADWKTYYTVLDTLAPQLIGVPSDMILSCSDPLPPMATVSVTDNCDLNVTPSSQENSTQLLNGSCNQYEYAVSRIWSAVDVCGNVARDTQWIFFLDNLPPTFTKPPDLTISCHDDATDFNITGQPENVTDNCDGSVDVIHEDRVIGDRSTFCYDIERTWRAADVCGNTQATIQFIFIRDTEAPTFIPPSNIRVDCSQGVDPSVTGEPSMVADNCDPEPAISFIDTEIAGSCENNPIINRLWRITDACGNRQQITQVITVTDERGPIFSTEAQDQIIPCNAAIDIDQAFQDWIDNRASAQASDNCSPDGNLRWLAFNSGTLVSPSLPPVNCMENDGLIRRQSVDFIVEDECGNQSVSTAIFGVEDASKPDFLSCPSDTTIAVNPGSCNAVYHFFPPAVAESCGGAMSNLVRIASEPITSNAAPGAENDVPVNPIDVAFTYVGLLPLNAANDATLTISLDNVDAEAEGEFFNILDENGALLGVTRNTSDQCGSSQTTITIPADDISRWAADGTIRFRLLPNIPDGQAGRFAINNLCAGGTVGLQLSFQSFRLEGLSLAYRLNEDPRQAINGFGLSSVSIERGINQMTLYAIDCAGNIDSCSFLINVEDNERPVAICPGDIERVLAPDSCGVSIDLPLPPAALDNCRAGQQINYITPRDTASAYLTFSYDPDLNDYIAMDKLLQFNGVAASAISDVQLQLDFRGDFNTTGAFMEIYGEMGVLLGSTPIGRASCSRSGSLTLTISRDNYNQWAADGTLEIMAISNDVPVPPGRPGDGINPCNPVNNDGDNDGESYLFGRISYDALVPEAYYAEGASPISLMQMQAPAITPTHLFSAGETDVFYIIADQSGNRDSCSFRITIEDREAPVAICQPTRVFINPSGLQVDTVQALVVDGGSTDNCEITSRSLSPSIFTCEAIGSIVPVTLTVADKAGNQSACSTMVRVETKGPEPIASSGLCGGDSLFLFANPPPATGGVVYTFLWSGPNGFTSTVENPVIPNVDAVNEGSYRVEIIGITDCSAAGTVEVSIKDLPLSSSVLTAEQICFTNDIVLKSSEIAGGAVVQYEWYEGLPPSGALLGTTSTPTFTLPGPQPPPANELTTTKDFYLIIQSDECRSKPSNPASVSLSQQPIAAVNQEQIEVCEGETVSLGSPITGEGISYEWSGPNDFSSSSQFPAAIDPVQTTDGGLYKLVVSRFGCASDPVFVNLTVLPKPATPLIFNSGPVCEGGDITLSTNVSDASVYHWLSSARADEIAMASPTLELRDLRRSDAADWRVYVTQFGCNSDLSEPSPLVVNAIPGASATADPQGVCEGQALRFFGAPNIVNASYRWEGPNNFQSSMQNPVINEAGENRAGQYLLTIESPEGCIGRDTVDIEVVEASFITGISNNAPACLSGPTDITLVASVFPPDNGNYEYRWTKPDGGSLLNQRSVTIRNATSAQNGTYQLVVVNDKGCASPSKSLELQVADPPATPPAPEATTAPPYCDDDPITIATAPYQGGVVEYIWNTPVGEFITTEPRLNLGDVQVSDQGNYTVIAKVNGCESQASSALNLQVNPVPTISASSNGPVCSGSLIDLTVTEIAGASYTWVGPGFTSSLRNPRISQADSALHAGKYKVIATLNGCISNIDSIDLIVKPKPQKPTAISDPAFCISDAESGLPLTIVENTATPGATYNWFGPTGEPIGATEELTFELGELANYSNGVYAFFAKAELNGCASESSLPTTVTLNTIPAIEAFAGTDTVLCEGSAYNLRANAPLIGVGEWSWASEPPFNASIDFPNQNNSPVSNLNEEGLYHLRWTLSNGACEAYDAADVVLTVKALQLPDAGRDQLACASQAVTLNADPPTEGRGVWRQSDVQSLLGVEIVDPSDPKTVIRGLEPGNLYSFKWAITEGCGNLEDEVLVLISDPNPDAGKDTIVCNDEAMVVLNAAEPTEGSYGEWSSVNPELVFSSIRSRKTTVMDLQPGENIFIWTIDGGVCGDFSRDTLRAFYKENPIAAFDTVTVGFGETLNFNVLTNDFTPPGSFVTITAGPRNGRIEEVGQGEFAYTPNINFVGVDELTYELCSEGCECYPTTATFFVGADAQCTIPSIITPNGDGINDVFAVPCLFDLTVYPTSQVVIINQWGDEVFRSSQPYLNDWDGTFNGEALPAGTYFYLLDYGRGGKKESGYLIIHR